ncbi:hypothetical protein AXG93_3482s1000 [Marchantia polymorpha subsp. ruderalis]|uniref:Uncharacterized protein n=1 Tax=Marchantia polymorpha subsp. ruderalis TaxID=1480154 RepID=A0A176VQP3_MARPO|nr:hypothetical protein AXG93_3482s1000 [Marchantia polymorpha subsp. ruderalis]
MRLQPKGQRLRRCTPSYECLRRQRIKIRSTPSGQATPYDPPSAERLRRAFGDAPKSTDVFKGMTSAEDLRLRRNDFGGAGKYRVENRPEAKVSAATPSALRE